MTYKYGEFIAGMRRNGRYPLSIDQERGDGDWKPPEPKDSSTLWRYMGLTKFLSLLNRRALFFSLVSDMEDSHEGFIYPLPSTEEGDPDEGARDGLTLLSATIRTSLISCWTKSEYESTLMWEKYAGKEGVAIRTTLQGLKDSFTSVEKDKARFGRVAYVDYKSEILRLDVAPLYHKRMEYREESEVRVVLPGPVLDADKYAYYRQGPNLMDVNILLDPDVYKHRGRYVPVDLGILVKEVVLPPKATFWFSEVVESSIRNALGNVPVIQSSVDAPPHAGG